MKKARPDQNRPGASGRPKRRRLWPLALVAIVVVIAAGLIAMHLIATRESRLASRLPELGDFASFQKDQAPARAICRALRLTELPDLSAMDPAGQARLYEAFERLRRQPATADAYGHLGQVYEAQRFPERADEAYQQAIELDPQNAHWRYALGLRRASEGEAPEAERLFAKACELEPGYAPAWMQRAWLALERGDREASLGHLKRYTALRPRDPFGYVQRARYYQNLGEWDRVQEMLSQARQYGPLGQEGHRLLGMMYRRQGNEKESRFHLALSAEPQPGGFLDDPMARHVEALRTYRYPQFHQFMQLFRTGRFREAIPVGGQLVQKYRGREDFKDWGVLCAALAECYRQTGQHDDAGRFAAMAIEAMPKSPGPHSTLAMSLLARNRLTGAMAEADAAIALDADPRESHLAWYARGLIRLRAALEPAAVPADLRAAAPEASAALAADDLERCVAAEPLNPLYIKALAHAQGLLGHYDRVLELVDTALRRTTDQRMLLWMKATAEARGSFWPQSSGGR